MLRGLRSRRRPRYGTHLCAATSAVLLLLSVTVLHSRLGFDRPRPPASTLPSSTDLALDANPLLRDAVSDYSSDDRIDELDIVDEDASRASDEEEILRGVELGDDGDDDDDDEGQSRVSSGFYFDHLLGVVRRAFDKRSIDKWEDYSSFDAGLFGAEDRGKVAFASDDVPVDVEVRRKASEARGIEEALLLKNGRRANPLREGWGTWFDKKSDFLRRDRMFKSNLDLLNPLNNPMLQDPDSIGTTVLTRGDRMVQKFLMNELKKKPFAVGHTPPSGMSHNSELSDNNDSVNYVKERSEMKRAERRTLDVNASYIGRRMNSSSAHFGGNLSHRIIGSNVVRGKIQGGEEKVHAVSLGEIRKSGHSGSYKARGQSNILVDGKRWGYFPGLPSHLSFLKFMDAFFKVGKCYMRVFMVWNSPSWMYLVRHQRGLESLLYHHRDACVVVFSETIELDFFQDFVKDGFKVAVVMPDLDELLKSTPAHMFSSIWFEWRKTKFYATHYSELIRLAALYKFGGIYLDSDVIVLKPLSTLTNCVGMEDHIADSSLNGAVMAFRKHSPFIIECLTEFYSTYDDTRLRWNGADLLTRVARRFLGKQSVSVKHKELHVQPSFVFFPINIKNVTRYFFSATTDPERLARDVLLERILNESLTVHFWNSVTSALVPEPESLVAKLIDHRCIHCLDIL